MEDWPLRKITEPHETNDVLLSIEPSLSGRSLRGSERFLELMIRENQQEYAEKSRLEKPKVALSILDAWRNQQPPGRFLVQEDNTNPPLWKDVGDKKARSHISRALKLACEEGIIAEKMLVELCKLNEDLNISERKTYADGSRDGVSPLFCLGSELCGRKNLINMLRDIYDRKFGITGETQSELILLSGPSGVGKTAVAKSLRKRVEEDGGFFVTRKFDQRHQSASPQVPFVTAFGDFAAQVKQRGDKTFRFFQETIKESLGSEIYILMETLPELGDFLDGKSKKVMRQDSESSDEPQIAVDVSERRARFLTVFRRLLRAMCNREHLIVLLLDDLQFADSTSLQLMASVLDPSEEPIDGLMLVGTVRGNDVSVGDDLSGTLRSLEDKGTRMTLIEVTSMSVQDLTEMVSAMLCQPMEDCTPLAEIVYAQTGGNALFAKQYLIELNRTGILYRESMTKWVWKEDSVVLSLDKQCPDDMIIQLLAGKINQLPSYVVDVIKAASCLGTDFGEEILCRTGQVVSSQVMLALEIAEEQGIIVYDVGCGECRFSHDKFQEAAYSLISKTDRSHFHYTIGRSLRQQLSTDEVKIHVFLVVDQLKKGVEHIQEQDEKDDLSRLSLLASRKAAKLSAFSAAVVYVNFGIDQLCARHWRDQYGLSLDLYSTAIELAYCTGNHHQVDAMVKEVAENARSNGDKQRAVMTQIVVAGSQGKSDRAVQLCIGMLDELGEGFPRKCKKARVVLEFHRIRHILKSMTEEEIINLRTLEDTRTMATMQIYFLLYPLLLLSDGDSSPIPAFRLIRLTLKFGLSSLSALGFLMYGISLIKMGESEEGYRYGHLALRILEKYPSKQLEARVSFAFYTFVESTKEPWHSLLGYQLKAHHLALKNGDMEIATISGVLHCMFRVFLGDSLHAILTDVKQCQNLCLSYGQLKVITMVVSLGQLICNLIGLNDDPRVLRGQFMDEESVIRQLQAENKRSLISVLYHFKYFLATYLNDYKYSKVIQQENRSYLANILVPDLQIYQEFFEGLNAAGLARCRKGLAKRRSIRKVQKFVKRLGGRLVHCPENIINKVYLVKAELEFCNGQYSTALLNYKKSISYAEREGFLSEQALASEKAGLMLKSVGREPEAQYYFLKAHDLYKRWGAGVKVQVLSPLVN